MEHYAGIDVSLEQSSVCVVDATGQIIREAKWRASRRRWSVLARARPAADPGRPGGRPAVAVAACRADRAGLEAVLLETRHVKAALSAMVV